MNAIVLGVALLFALFALAAALTFRRRLQRSTLALERSQRDATVGLVTAGFAHEMKNALTVILGFAELARSAAEKQGIDGKVLRHVGEVEKEAQKTVAQLSNFLSYASAAEIPRSLQQPNQLVEESLAMIRPMARIKELLVVTNLGEPPEVLVEPFAIRQLCLNLLLNAIDFSKTQLTVSTSRAADGSAEIAFADDGPGVPDAERGQVFHRFFSSRPGGSGLGLFTARKIAVEHGGTLTLEEGSGARFLLRLPAAKT